ncbi:sigma-70 family RNA polymerase sigma factor [Alkalihalobacillus pseudalcaliphilus]|uniref:sigma-70 family RNA polymerase sigma factor n=1 Tax=Alkalihalobacillus pseudalcaliphilus TaxID=79884 RepID=UPI00064DA956|nr:sigma-70 family RNA polymerase sigma factor [Alkalihalobacillus pseudalcaliphilus]KMK75334.1 hypothetical protein AB990_18150 [Alkalihalobacillus pseudalcaliphilus]
MNEQTCSTKWGQEEELEVLLNDLMTNYGTILKRHIYLYVHNWTVADDLTQDVFITVYMKYHQLKEKELIKSWLFQIATNKARDYLRSWAYRKLIFTDSVSHKKSLSSDSLEDVLFSREGYSELLEAVLQLPIKYREVIILFYYHDFTLREVKDILCVPQATVKTRLARAKQKLREHMSNKEKGDRFG